MKEKQAQSSLLFKSGFVFTLTVELNRFHFVTGLKGPFYVCSAEQHKDPERWATLTTGKHEATIF